MFVTFEWISDKNYTFSISGVVKVEYCRFCRLFLAYLTVKIKMLPDYDSNNCSI